ncbi:short-chain dehydrogenase/reductase SDR [Halalkaliarchaeum desulfuricum]|uniref:Short-chain dehydrogenase/reductase SDR n=1 Tax=Halalkaliarchaeum desulfuricum TaxID=2055893 RepID=A0A343TP33_9EURY|nr:short-chain dehydrogenase/reductase SDR [Halalkaliarchaeum desulfuricum]
MGWSVEDVPDQTGRRIVITGANSGIGFEAASVLAREGARVVMACRSLDRGEAAAEEIREAAGDVDLAVRRLDLADLESVRSFPNRLAPDDRPIDVLVNNAGIMGIPRHETDEGFEQQFGVNHLGHFALTGVLCSDLADKARVVTVSSGMHERGEIDFEDLHGEKSYGKWDAYAQSKLANLLFAYELDRRAEDADTSITSVGVHPGYADTSLQSRGPELAGSPVRKAMMRVANAIFAQPAADGALPTLYAATAPDVEGGEYYGPGGLLNMRGPPERQQSSERSYDRETARRLWELSEELTGVQFDLE